MKRTLPQNQDTENQAIHSEQDENIHKWWVLIAIGIGTFMTALDSSVVNTILPVVNTSFQTSVAAVEWVVTIYLLVLSGFLLSFGRVGDLRGHKTIYISGFFVFLLSSAFCGFAPSISFLIGFRALQALGAAMLSANSPAILTKSFPSNQRGQALGFRATLTYLGLLVGPSLGGYLADTLSWRAVFYINIPIGLIALGLSIHFILPDSPGKLIEKFDWTGAALFLFGLTALLLGLNQGHAWGWGSWPIILLLIFSFGLLIIFIGFEKRNLHPMLDLQLFRNKVFSATVASAVINYVTVFMILFLIPFYLIQGRGFSATKTGLILTAQPIVMAIIAPISGTLSDRYGTRSLCVFGMSILAISFLILARLNSETPIAQILLSLGMAGFGTGTFISPNTSALLGSAPYNRQGIASGILASARNVGMVLGVGLAGAIFTTSLHQGENISQVAIFESIHLSFIIAAMLAFLGTALSAIRS